MRSNCRPTATTMPDDYGPLTGRNRKGRKTVSFFSGVSGAEMGFICRATGRLALAKETSYFLPLHLGDSFHRCWGRPSPAPVHRGGRSLSSRGSRNATCQAAVQRWKRSRSTAQGPIGYPITEGIQLVWTLKAPIRDWPGAPVLALSSHGPTWQASKLGLCRFAALIHCLSHNCLPCWTTQTSRGQIDMSADSLKNCCIFVCFFGHAQRPQLLRRSTVGW